MTKERFNDLLLRIFGIFGFLVTAILAMHQSKYPVFLGLYSTRYALILLGLILVSAGLISFSLPGWRARLAQRSVRTASRRQAWVLMFAGWLALPVSFGLLRMVLPANDDRDLTIAFVLVVEVAVMVGVLWWTRAAERVIRVQRPTRFLVGLTAIAYVLIVLFHGKVPPVTFFDEVWSVGTAWKQYNDLSNFTSISPDRNADTWFNFPAFLPVAGAYMKLFGVGILQARFFYFLLAQLALPFIYFITRHYYGNSAAFAALALGLFAPLHFNYALSHIWVSTATSIALFCYISARKSEKRFARLFSFCCGLFAVSAVEGHVYGGAFALVFCALHFVEFIAALRRQQRPSAGYFLPFVMGCVCFSTFWMGYHIILPDLQISEVIDRIRETYRWESQAIGASGQGGVLNPAIWKKALPEYLSLQQFEFFLLNTLIGFVFLRRRIEDIKLAGFWVSGYFLISLFIAHLNINYVTFYYPPMCILFGAFVKHLFPGNAKFENMKGIAYSLGGFYLLVAALCLFSIHTVTVASSDASKVQGTLLGRHAEIGKNINALLPPEEIIVASGPGGHGYYYGMPYRLGYYNSFSFTWGLPEYWPLDPPQAIIVTLGVDETWSGLREWVQVHEFQAVACYHITGVGEEEPATAILYWLPELGRSNVAENCTPEMLGWVHTS